MTAAATRMTLPLAPLEELMPSGAGFFNPRSKSGLASADVAELAADIHARGLRDPLHVWQAEVDRVVHLVVVRGQRRLLALQMLDKAGKLKGTMLERGIPYVPIQAPNLAAAMVESLVDQAHGVPLSTAEWAEYMEKLATMGLTNREIAKRLGKSESWVGRITKAWSAATPVLREAWSKGKVTDESAKALAQVPVDKQDDAVREYLDATKSGNRQDKAAAREKAASLAVIDKPTINPRKEVAAAKPGPKPSATGKPAPRIARTAEEVEDVGRSLEISLPYATGRDRALLEGVQAALRWLTAGGELPEALGKGLLAHETSQRKKRSK